MTYSLETASWRCCPAPIESVCAGHPRRLLIIRSERCFDHVSESFRRISSRGMDETDDALRFLNCAGAIVAVVLSAATTTNAWSVPPREKCASAVKLETTAMYITDAASSVMAPGIHAPTRPLAYSIVTWVKKQRAQKAVSRPQKWRRLYLGSSGPLGQQTTFSSAARNNARVGCLLDHWGSRRSAVQPETMPEWVAFCSSRAANQQRKTGLDTTSTTATPQLARIADRPVSHNSHSHCYT